MASDESRPVPVERLISDGYARFNAGDRAGARALLRRVPRSHQLAIESQRLLGVIAYAEGDFREAGRQFERVIKHGRPRPMDHANMGLALTALGKFAHAERQIRRAIAEDPALVEGWFNLGNLYLRTQKLEAAVGAYAKMIEVAPADPRAHFNRGIAFARWRRPADAIQCFERTLEINPGFIDARNEMGLGLAALGDQDGAEGCYRQVLEADPGHQVALANLGNALAARRRFDEALDYLDRAYKRPIANVEVTVSYAEILLRVGRTREAEALFDRALALAPENGRSLAALAMIYQWQCRWDALEAVQAKLLPLALREASEDRRSPIAPHTALSQFFTPAEERLIAESWSRDLTRDMNTVRRDDAFSYPPRDRERIRLGDDDGSDWRRRIEAASDRFADVTHESYADTAARMNRDEVDILLDFKGFTAEARPQVYALRPAPIQVNYLGFPGTIGADWMDYLVADEIVIPPDERIHYAEQIVYLPESYQANDDRQPIGAWPETRADMGLPDNVIVFSCFNETYKIDRAIFGVWMRILGQVPGSVLWLRDHSEELRASLRGAAADAGISPDRLFFAESLPKEQHLARCRLADLFLDSYALTAHTTATDSLWAGVPVLTCPRNTFATRVGRSLLQNVGLPELAVDSLEEYEALAIRLATQPHELDAFRNRLRRNLETEPLFDTQRLTRHLEEAFSGMWERYLDGRAPESFRVEPIEGAVRSG